MKTTLGRPLVGLDEDGFTIGFWSAARTAPCQSSEALTIDWRRILTECRVNFNCQFEQLIQTNNRRKRIWNRQRKYFAECTIFKLSSSTLYKLQLSSRTIATPKLPEMTTSACQYRMLDPAPLLQTPPCADEDRPMQARRLTLALYLVPASHTAGSTLVADTQMLHVSQVHTRTRSTVVELLARDLITSKSPQIPAKLLMLPMSPCFPHQKSRTD